MVTRPESYWRNNSRTDGPSYIPLAPPILQLPSRLSTIDYPRPWDTAASSSSYYLPATDFRMPDSPPSTQFPATRPSLSFVDMPHAYPATPTPTPQIHPRIDFGVPTEQNARFTGVVPSVVPSESVDTGIAIQDGSYGDNSQGLKASFQRWAHIMRGASPASEQLSDTHSSISQLRVMQSSPPPMSPPPSVIDLPPVGSISPPGPSRNRPSLGAPMSLDAVLQPPIPHLLDTPPLPSWAFGSTIELTRSHEEHRA